MSTKDLTRTVEDRLTDSPASRFWQELFRNSGYFPIALILLELLVEGLEYLANPDLYILIPAVLVQTYILTRWTHLSAWRRFLGNLAAPGLYALGEVSFEGLAFFQSPYHVPYLIFALIIGLLQAAQSRERNLWNDSLLLLENVVRAEIIFALYVAVEVTANPAQTISLTEFFADGSHLFLALAVFLLGLSAGAANVNAQRFSLLLRETAGQLKVYSEWLLGRDLLGRALDDPNSMRLSRQKRTILFADIRGFTGWSESHSPEEVASLVNRYYATVEATFGRYRVVKFKFTADEAMAVFLEADEAVRAALDLRLQCERILNRHGLGAGIGLHTGQVVEGLLGSPQLRFYDALGDTVNTANRIEKSAASGEVWISEGVFSHLNNRVPVDEPQFITVKGKDQPVRVYRILT